MMAFNSSFVNEAKATLPSLSFKDSLASRGEKCKFDHNIGHINSEF